MFIVLLELLVVGLFLEKILMSAGKDVSPEQMLDKALIYYFLFVGKFNGMNRGDVEQFTNNLQSFFGSDILLEKKYIRDMSKGRRKKWELLPS